jgi:hypothetical protein
MYHLPLKVPLKLEICHLTRFQVFVEFKTRLLDKIILASKFFQLHMLRFLFFIFLLALSIFKLLSQVEKIINLSVFNFINLVGHFNTIFLSSKAALFLMHLYQVVTKLLYLQIILANLFSLYFHLFSELVHSCFLLFLDSSNHILFKIIYPLINKANLLASVSKFDEKTSRIFPSSCDIDPPKDLEMSLFILSSIGDI